MHRSGDLVAQLRQDTADLHAAVEQASGLPNSVRSASDYSALLRRLLAFHLSAESAIAARAWEACWAQFGVDLDRHTRSGLLVADLTALADPFVDPLERPPLRFPTFGAALGCLYVMEGSAVGGRTIAPAIRQQLGEAPTSFFDSAGRGHPGPWLEVKRALQRYGVCEPDRHADVVDGARTTFAAFHDHVAIFQAVSRR